MEIYSNKQVRI